VAAAAVAAAPPLPLLSGMKLNEFCCVSVRSLSRMEGGER
jgi:hypothetical protein